MLFSLHAAKPTDSFVYFGTYTNAKTESNSLHQELLVECKII